MSPEAQRIAIAESLGWTQRTEGLMWSETTKRAAIVQGSNLEAVRKKMGLSMDNGVMLPDYLNDLNAAHDAEVALIYDKSLGLVYLLDLQKVCNETRPAKWDTTDRTLPCTSATAAQRTEAILHATGRWDTTK